MNDKKKDFCFEDFKSPDRSHAPIYGWVWDGPLSYEKIDAQIAEMRRLGICAFYIIPEPQNFRPTTMPTRMDHNYLTTTYFEYYRYAMDKAEENGMECWLYDEAGWPSGGACGQVLFEHPECARRHLRRYKKQYKSGEIYRKTREDEAVFVGGVMLGDGYAFDNDTEADVYDSYAQAWERPGIPDYPDLTMKESTEAFLNITHEQYKVHLGDKFGKTMTAVFTDEPKSPGLPFRAELCKAYEQKYRESILPHLPVLYGAVPLNEENIKYKVLKMV